jgi:hypothetical protein
MKKLLFGCLFIIVLGAIVAGVGSYLLYRAASPLIDDARSYLDGMSQLDEIERQITNKGDYSGPASGELTETQVRRFARVQQHVRGSLGKRMDEIEAKYEYLRSSGDTKSPPITELLSSLRDIAGVYLDARRYQVEALNKEGFSQDEYSWVRDRVFAAAGMEIGSRIDLESLQDAVRNGTGLESIGTDQLPKVNVPPRNRELVKPYVAQMDEWLPLMFFGL